MQWLGLGFIAVALVWGYRMVSRKAANLIERSPFNSKEDEEDGDS